MKYPTPHEPTRSPQTGIDRSINQDDDADHPVDTGPTHARRDALSGTDAWNKPGLVDDRNAARRPTQVDFDFGPAHERRRH